MHCYLFTGYKIVEEAHTVHFTLRKQYKFTNNGETWRIIPFPLDISSLFVLYLWHIIVSMTDMFSVSLGGTMITTELHYN